MITIHPSMNLIKRIRPFGGNGGTADAEHMMRTWYCSYRIVRSRHMVMALNEETLLPVVAPLTSMTKTAGPTLQRLMHAGLHSFGIPGEIIVRECAAMSAWSVEKRINRSMTGWMNDIWRSVVYMIDDGLPTPRSPAASPTGSTARYRGTSSAPAPLPARMRLRGGGCLAFARRRYIPTARFCLTGGGRGGGRGSSEFLMPS